jgi:hypothetical protein
MVRENPAQSVPRPRQTDYRAPERRLGIAITGVIAALVVAFVIWWIR